MIPSLTRNCSYSEHRDHAIKINQFKIKTNHDFHENLRSLSLVACKVYFIFSSEFIFIRTTLI